MVDFYFLLTLTKVQRPALSLSSSRQASWIPVAFGKVSSLLCSPGWYIWFGYARIQINYLEIIHTFELRIRKYYSCLIYFYFGVRDEKSVKVAQFDGASLAPVAVGRLREQQSTLEHKVSPLRGPAEYVERCPSQLGTKFRLRVAPSTTAGYVDYRNPPPQLCAADLLCFLWANMQNFSK